ncbi:family 43 glycosylhydrolase [Elizabethkingia anophelis]|nr:MULTISPECIES: family 43 glycosylhydrolase [Elizabethkingia]MDX8560700.1 family 43 glycosylhydrolase [Elizabethkingia sp. HX ZCH]MDX8579309.1 family 43 glycosylhydrolase [Elizabethkingia sp. HX YK]
MKILIIISVFFHIQIIAQVDTIFPSQIWKDQFGNHIQAHGGGIIKIKDTYYWYGEQRGRNIDPQFRYVSCYASKDLVNWTFKKNVMQLSDPENLGNGWVLERPKVFYNKTTKKYVMYFHLDNHDYSYAHVGIAVSDKPDGDYKYLKNFRPLGRPSRDIGQFIDDDGSAYLIFEDRNVGFHIARLSNDYLSVEKEMSLVKTGLEGGAIVNYDGLYYVIGSGITGWSPNPNKFATAKSLEGPWSEFKDIAPPETNTYNSQSTMMIKVVGSKATTVIFMADQWKPSEQWDSRYLWMPLEIGKGELKLPAPRPWILNVKTGESKILNE